MTHTSAPVDSRMYMKVFQISSRSEGGDLSLRSLPLPFGECQTQSVKAPHPLRLGEGLSRSKKDRLTLPAVLRCPTVPHLQSLWPTSAPSWVLWGLGFLGLLDHTDFGVVGVHPPPQTPWMLRMSSDPRSEVGICETKGQCAFESGARGQ